MSKEEEFTCGNCFKEFIKLNSEKEAMEEAVDIFGEVENPVLVCDDCYNELMGAVKESGTLPN